MNFALSEEQELLQETVRGWVEKECPAATVRAVVDGDADASDGLWKGLDEMGIGGLLVPEDLGGAGLELLDLALVAEELGRGAVPVPFLGHSLATLAIALAGDDAQKSRWLPGLAAGELRGCAALAEPGDRWEPGDWTASLEGGRISAVVDPVPGAAGAQLAVVGVRGGGLAVVELEGEGVRREAIDALDRTRPLDRIVLEGARAEALPGRAATRVRDAGLVLLASDAFGAGHALVRMSAAYAQTRQQFGQPIAQFQAVKHQLADMALEVDPTRGLWWFAAHAFDHLPAESERAAALAKAHVTDRVMQVARSAVEVHGGLGFTWECDVQIWFKRAMFDRMFLGGPDGHRDRVAALGGW